MPLTPDDLRRIAARTLAHCDQHAQAFWEGTRDHDVMPWLASVWRKPIETDAPSARRGSSAAPSVR